MSLNNHIICFCNFKSRTLDLNKFWPKLMNTKTCCKHNSLRKRFCFRTLCRIIYAHNRNKDARDRKQHEFVIQIQNESKVKLLSTVQSMFSDFQRSMLQLMTQKIQNKLGNTPPRVAISAGAVSDDVRAVSDDELVPVIFRVQPLRQLMIKLKCPESCDQEVALQSRCILMKFLLENFWAT